MRTVFESMRLGAVIYFLPFFFVLNPVLVRQGVTPVASQSTAATQPHPWVLLLFWLPKLLLTAQASRLYLSAMSLATLASIFLFSWAC